MTEQMNRRTALQCIAISSLSLGASASMAISSKLQPSDPDALKLGYVDNATRVDVKKYPHYKQGQTCANCQLIQLRYGPLRPCAVFPGKMVAASGWCSAWSVKTFDQ